MYSNGVHHYQFDFVQIHKLLIGLEFLVCLQVINQNKRRDSSVLKNLWSYKTIGMTITGSIVC